MLVFVGLVLLVLGVIHLYLWKRLVRDTTVPGRLRRVGTGLLVVLLILPMVALVGGRSWPMSVLRPLEWVGLVWVGVMFYIFVVLLVLELPRAALWIRVRREDGVDPGRRLFLSRALAGTALVLSAGAAVVGVVTATGRVPVNLVRVRLGRLDPALSGYRIAVLADVHLGPLIGSDELAEQVRTVNAESPDLVAVVGDLVDGSVAELGEAAETLLELRAEDGIFFVTGNHEYYSGAQEWVDFLSGIGVRVLRNERVEIGRDGAAFDLAGVDDVSAAGSGEPGHGADLGAALAGRDTSRPVVVLAHQPVLVDAAAEQGVDLQISAHTHGGQIWPFHYIVRLSQPALAGLSRVRETWLYVSRGTGFAGPPMRVGASPEITIIELLSAAS